MMKTICHQKQTSTGRRLLRRGSAVAAAIVAASALAACSSDTKSDEVSVSEPWVRVTPGTKDMTAAYMDLESPVDDRLVGARVASDIAETVELHETTGSHSESMSGEMEMGDQMGPGKGNMADSDDMSNMDASSESMSEMDGQMKMMGMKQVSSIDLPAGDEVSLEPGGYHIMLMGLKRPIESGDQYQITLEFEKAGEVDVQAIARDN